jgi:signal transduction histidine kinase
MSRNTWPVFLVGLCSLLMLILFPGISTLQRTDRILRDIRQIQGDYQRSERALDELSSHIHSVSILVRDFLLDSSPVNGERYRSQMQQDRSQIDTYLRELGGLLGPEDAGPFNRLTNQMSDYWVAIMPVFDWTPEQRREQATYFLRQQQRPRRESLIAMTDELTQLNASAFQRQYDSLDQSLRKFRNDSATRLRLAALIGLAIASVTVFRIWTLERKSREHQAQTEAAEREMRDLSGRLMRAQEEERRAISRELHDEVGQMLTGLRMELGTLERGRLDEKRFREHVRDAKKLAEDTMRIVRDLARGLRPTVLDDLGLAPALQWQARQFGHRTGIKVSVSIRTDAEALAETHRTCLYRVVQEALTNCAKHAQATEIRITLDGDADSVALTVEDNGVGIGVPVPGGLGLIGIEERVRELGGVLEVGPAQGGGTRLRAQIPFQREVVA